MSTGRVHFEFHASMSDTQDLSAPAAPRVCRCVVRMKTQEDTHALREVWPELCKRLERLVGLQTVVLETAGDVQIRHSDESQSLIDALRKTSGAAIHYRTCDEVHSASQKVKSPRPSVSLNTEPLSPFWCLPKHARSWKSW